MIKPEHTAETSFRIGAFLATIAGVVLLLSSVSSAALVMDYETSLDIVTGQERAIRPTAVSCDPATGEICVTDAQYSTFHVFNNRRVEVFRTGGFSLLSNPIDGTGTSDGGFVFIARDLERTVVVRRLNFMGEPVDFTAERPIEPWEPAHLAIAGNGDLLTVDSFHSILSRHDPHTGALIWHVDVTGDDATDMQLGRPVEAPDGRIYVPGGMTHNVTVFSDDGTRLKTFGTFGSGPGKMVYPVGVAIGQAQSILVLDRMRHKVMVFSPDHELLGDLGSRGAGLGQFYHPSAIAASDNGTVYVAQGYGGRIQVFNIHDTTVE